MAIDFSQVRAITIPEGSVKQIEDSNGNVLWKEKTLITTTVNVPCSQFMTFTPTTLGGTTYRRINFNSGYVNTIKSYITNQLGISSSDIDSITYGNLHLYLYWNSSNTYGNYTYRLYNSTSNTGIVSGSQYSCSLIKTNTGNAYKDYSFYLRSSIDFETIGTGSMYVWYWGQSGTESDSSYSRQTSSPPATFYTNTPSNSYLAVTVKYYQ